MKTLTLPHPENPHHISNLASIPLLKAQGFKGLDACLAESLFEYGLIWRHLEDGEVLFVYPSPYGKGCFHRCSFKADIDPRTEWDWVKWGNVAASAGESVLTYPDGLPLETVVLDLVRHYGPLEIFGEEYWEGFTVSVSQQSSGDRN